MYNMLDYMELWGKVPFAEKPFSEVDNLIFSQLSYCEYEGISLPCPLRCFPRAPKPGLIEENSQLFRLASRLPRYRDTVAYAYQSRLDEEKTAQFSAITFLLPDGTAFVSYRGTDSTLVGWKEDFMLSFATPVPAQRLARDYLDALGSLLDCPLRVGGHSKGGNLAVYAAAFCRETVRARILQVYSNDGPGFEPEITGTEEFARILPRVRRFIPESSPIGMLLEYDTDYTIIDSSSLGIFQHNPYSWKTDRNGFVTKEDRSLGGDIVSSSLHLWLKSMSEEKREFLTDTLFGILDAGEEDTVRGLRKNPTAILNCFRAVGTLSDEDRRQMKQLLSLLWDSIKGGSRSAFKDHLDDIGDDIQDLIRKIRD